MSNAAWSDDRVTTLCKLWVDGLSASQIAKQLGGVTRNAVIGKIHRLGLAARGAGGRARPSRPAPRKNPAARPFVKPARPTSRIASSSPLEPDRPGLICSLVALHGHVCKWPLGDPRAQDFSFCGERTEGGSYCPTHDRKAHRPGTAKPLTHDPLVRRVLAVRAA